MAVDCSLMRRCTSCLNYSCIVVVHSWWGLVIPIREISEVELLGQREGILPRLLIHHGWLGTKPCSSKLSPILTSRPPRYTH